MKNPRRKANPREGGEGRAVHDLGGLPAGPVDRSEHALSLYEKRVDALLMLLVGPKRELFRVDALRRAVEDYSQQEYDGLGYYDRWIGAIRNLLVEQAVLSETEIEGKLDEVRARLRVQGVRIEPGGTG